MANSEKKHVYRYIVDPYMRLCLAYFKQAKSDKKLDEALASESGHVMMQYIQVVRPHTAVEGATP